MARVAIQFVANSNMGAVSKDIMALNGQLAALAQQMRSINATADGPARIQNISNEFKRAVDNISGYETTTMSARTATNRLTDDINRQRIAMKDMAEVRKNLNNIVQEQMRLQNSSAMITGYDQANGRVMGELVTPTNEFGPSMQRSAIEAAVLGKAMQSAGQQTVAAGKRMQWTGRQLATGLTAPIVAVGAVSAKAAYDIDAAMVRVEKVYGGLAGVTEEEMDRVKAATMETARTVASDFGLAGKETVALAGDFAAAGYEGAKLQEATYEAQRISLLGELDRQKVLESTIAIQTVYKDSVHTLGEEFNFLNAVEGQTNTTLKDLTEVIPRTASVINGLGGTLRDSAVLTVGFKEAGIDAVQGANALRSSIGAIVAPSGVAEKKLANLGVNIRQIAEENSKENGGGIIQMLNGLNEAMAGLDSGQRYEALATLFGRYQYGKMDALLKSLAVGASNATTQVGRAMALTQASAEELAEVANRETKAITESLSGRLRIAAQEIVLSFAEIGRPILNLAVEVVEFFSGVLKAINSLPGPIKTVMGLFLGMLALAGPLMFFKGIFTILRGVLTTMRGAALMGAEGVKELLTSNTAFAKHAANSVIPTTNAQADAAQRLATAYDRAASSVRRLSAENANIGTNGLSVGTQAGKKMVTRRDEKGVPVKGEKARPQNPMAAFPGIIGLPGPTIAKAEAGVDRLNDKTKKLGVQTDYVRSKWTNVAQGIGAAIPLMAVMSGTTNQWIIGLSQASLLLTLFPTQIDKMGKAIAASAAGQKLVGIFSRTEGKVGLVTKGVAKLRSGILSAGTALRAAAGPIGLIVTGIMAAVGVWKMYQNSIKSAREEQARLNNASASMAGIIGYNYKPIGTTDIEVDPETGEAIKNITEKTKEWEKANKKTAKSLEEMNDTQLKRQALMIGVDARKSGATAEQALEAVKIALRAGRGDLADDLMLDMKINFNSPMEVAQANADLAGEEYLRVLNNKFKQGKVEGFGRMFNNKAFSEDLNGAAAEAARGLGKTFARELDNTNKQEVRQSFEAMQKTINDQLVAKYGDLINLTEEQAAAIREAGVNPTDTAAVINYLKAWEGSTVMRDAAGNNIYLDSSLNELSGELVAANTAEKEFVAGLLKARGIPEAQAAGIETLAAAQQLLGYNVITVAAAQKTYNTKMDEAAEKGTKYTNAQQLAILNSYRLQAGLPPATSVLQGFSGVAAEAADKLDLMAGAMDDVSKDAAGFASGVRSKLQSNLSDAVGLLMEDFDATTEAYKDGVQVNEEMWEDAYEIRKDAATDAFEEEKRLLGERFDLERTALDETHDQQMTQAEKARDAAIKAIEDEMDKADELDDKRKAIFEAEITRMERLQGQYNRNIDFNVALKGGDLDEAARIQEAGYVEYVSNQIEDAGAGMDSAAAIRRANGEARVDAVTTIEDQRIADLEKLQSAEVKAFEERKRIAEAEVESRKKASDDIFEIEKRNHERAAQAAERSYDKARAAKRKQVEESLQQTAAEVPLTIEEYEKMFVTLDGQYAAQTGKSAEKTREWTDMHRNGWKTAMDDTLSEMGNSAAWRRMGEQSMDEMMKGMLGMTFDEYITWVETGVKPNTNTTASGAPKAEGGNTNRYNNVTEFDHAGGPVGVGGSGRAGRPLDAPLYPDEVPAVLQKGEYVLDRETVRNLGVDNIKAMHAAKGQTSFYHSGGMVGAVGAGIMSTFRSAMEVAVRKQAAQKAQEFAAAGQYDEIPEALRFVATAAKGGKYGGTSLTDEQMRNAATIIGVGRSMGATEKDLTVAIMTALQESSLRNLPSGDRDSLGLFQQRPSQGWGSAADIMDPAYAARKFFETLLSIKGRDDLGLTQTAQKVQRSAFPDAYAKWEDEAVAILAATSMAGVGGPQYAGTGRYTAFGGTVTGDIQGLQVEFLNRLARWSAALGQTYNVGSGYRSMEEQARLYNAYRAGVPGQAPAAPPGRSNHNFGLASDGPRWRDRGPERFGLTYPMSYEPWHIEPIGAKGMRIPQLEVGGHVNFDNTLANLHKNETVLTAPLSSKLEKGINQLDSGTTNQYNITVNGAGADAETVADRVMKKIQRMEQVKGPKRVIK